MKCYVLQWMLLLALNCIRLGIDNLHASWIFWPMGIRWRTRVQLITNLLLDVVPNLLLFVSVKDFVQPALKAAKSHMPANTLELTWRWRPRIWVL